MVIVLVKVLCIVRSVASERGALLWGETAGVLQVTDFGGTARASRVLTWCHKRIACKLHGASLVLLIATPRYRKKRADGEAAGSRWSHSLRDDSYFLVGLPFTFSSSSSSL